MERIWYYGSGVERHGPHTESEMRSLLAQGIINPGTLVWSEGMADWVLLSASELAPAAVTPAAAPPRVAQAPENLRAWMQFCGIMLILGGALQCLSCIGAIFGVPLILAGAAFGGAASKLDSLGAVDPRVADLLLKLRAGFKALGVGIIISLVVTLLVLGLYLAIGVALLRTLLNDFGVSP
jgi:hypothetical protein